MKEEALKLADELLRDNTQLTVKSAYAIRRLVEELDKPHPKCDKACMYLCQTKPLSDEEIGDILFKYGEKDEWFNFAKAIEERHGIK